MKEISQEFEPQKEGKKPKVYLSYGGGHPGDPHPYEYMINRIDREWFNQIHADKLAKLLSEKGWDVGNRGTRIEILTRGKEDRDDKAFIKAASEVFEIEENYIK